MYMARRWCASGTVVLLSRFRYVLLSVKQNNFLVINNMMCFDNQTESQGTIPLDHFSLYMLDNLILRQHSRVCMHGLA